MLIIDNGIKNCDAYISFVCIIFSHMYLEKRGLSWIKYTPKVAFAILKNTLLPFFLSGKKAQNRQIEIAKDIKEFEP